jgi:serine/threonine protein kinase
MTSGVAVTSVLTPRLAAKYSVFSKLGEGSYGVVYKVQNRDTHELCAIKLMDLGDAHRSLGINKSTLVEVSLLKRLNHPNIVKVFEIDIDEEAQKINVVMELAQCALDDAIKTQWFKPGMRSRRTEQMREQLRIAFQITCALNYLHTNRIIHLDLKPANILIRSNGTVAVADFGISERSNSSKSEGHHVVTWPYRAPEIVCGAQSYQEASDIWSLGVLLLLNFFDLKLVSRAGDKESQLYTHFVERVGPMSSAWHTEYRRNQLTCPLQSTTLDVRTDEVLASEYDVKKTSPRPKYHNDIHPFYTDFYGKNTYNKILSFIDQCLQYDPRERASAKILLAHPLFEECIVEKTLKRPQVDKISAHRDLKHAAASSAVLTQHKLHNQASKDALKGMNTIACYVCDLHETAKHVQVQRNKQTPALLYAKFASALSESTVKTCIEIFNRYMRVCSIHVSTRLQTETSNEARVIEAACLMLAGKLMNDKTMLLRLNKLAEITNVSESMLQKEELHIVNALDWNFDGEFSHADWKGDNNFQRQ